MRTTRRQLLLGTAGTFAAGVLPRPAAALSADGDEIGRAHV